jgi:hypothetical protein
MCTNTLTLVQLHTRTWAYVSIRYLNYSEGEGLPQVIYPTYDTIALTLIYTLQTSLNISSPELKQ